MAVFEIDELRDVAERWDELLPLFEGQAAYHAPLLGLEPATNWRELLLERFRHTDNLVLLARAGGQAIGFLSASTTVEDRLWDDAYVDIDNVYVREDWRKRGVARALLARAEAWALSRGIGKVELGVLANNDPALAIWTRMGFRPISHRMAKTLAEPS